MNIDYDLIASKGIQVLAYERSSIERCKTVFEGATDKIVKMIGDWTLSTGMEMSPSGENSILHHLYHLYYLPRDI